MTIERTRSRAVQQDRMARRIVEAVLPLALAAAPYGAVLQLHIPLYATDAIVVIGILFAVLLTSTFARLPGGLVLLGIFGVIAAALTQRPNLFAVALIPLIVFALRHVDVWRVLRIFVAASAFLFIAVVGAYTVTGFNADFDVYMWREYSQSWADRQAFGFSHPNRAMPAWAVVVIGTFALAGARGRALWFLPLAAVTAYLYVGSDSRTSTILIVGFLALALLIGRRLDRPASPALRALAVGMPIFLTLLSFALSAFAAEPAINTLLSGRPVIYANLLDNFSILAPFGNEAVETEIVDSGYIQLVLAKGLPLAAIYLVTLTVVIARAKLSWRSFLIAGSFLALSLAETALLNLAFLFLVLASLEIDRRCAHEPENLGAAGVHVATRPRYYRR